ncbi:MAG: hypothetical protein NWR72_18475 [Bacteroidia bacterium]|nr:hypothetical protein [Bacteroidia bacterium]
MTNIRSLTLYLHEPENVAAWYQALGFSLRKRGMVQHISAGYTDLRMIPGEEGSWFHLAFHVRGECFDRVVQELQKTITLLPAYEDGRVVREFPSWKAKSVYAHDPAGNIVEWITRPAKEWQNLPKPLPDIVGVAEIGIPVAHTNFALEKATNFLPTWDQFGDGSAALGSEEGLILMVPNGRAWLPTSRPAEFHPCSGTLEHEGKRIFFNTLNGQIQWSYSV